MKESIFGEFQYFIRRINAYNAGANLTNGETIEDLEQRFRVQVESGLVINEPQNQEIAMAILLSELSEMEKRQYLMELRKTGKTKFEMKKAEAKTLNSLQGLSLDQKRERALDLIAETLKKANVKAQKQPLGVKMLMAEYELNNFNYDDPKDLRLLFVNTIRISGHAKKADPLQLANIFNKILAAC
jgi:hypothetical protein